MPANLRRLSIAAGIATAAIPLLFAIYEVQGWTMPTPLAIILTASLYLIIVGALVVICWEVVMVARNYWQKRTVTAAWLSDEEPGLLDYEPDYARASKRFLKEINKLSRDTAKLGEKLSKHRKDTLESVKRGNPQEKQKRGNQAGTSINKSAVFFEMRAKLLDALVKEIGRNAKGQIAHVNIQISEQEDIEAAQFLRSVLDKTVNSATGAIASLSGYIDSVNYLAELNPSPSRSIRVASQRLRDALDHVLKILQEFQSYSRQLTVMLEKRVPSKQ